MQTWTKSFISLNPIKIFIMKQCVNLHTQYKFSHFVLNDTIYLNNLMGQVPASEEVKSIILTNTVGKYPRANDLPIIF